MTVQTVPYALQNASHSAAVFRQSASAAFLWPGILGVGELAVSAQSTPNMSVVLGPGRAKVGGTNVAAPAGLLFTTQAMYDVLNDGNITLTIAAANATNPRIDAIYIGVQDSFYSGSTNQAIAGVVTGVAAATPVPPAVPSNALLLGYVAVAANASSIGSSNISAPAVQATLNTPAVNLFNMNASSTAGVGAGRSATVTSQTVQSPGSQAAWITFTSAMQGTSGTNWAGNVSVTVNGQQIGGYTRIGDINMAGNSVVPVTRIVKALLSAGSNTVTAQASTDSASSGTVFYNNPQLEVWSA